MGEPAKHFYEFGPFRLDPVERLLLRGDDPVELTPKAFDTLVVLVGNGGHLLSKDELMSSVWPGTVVEENNLAQVIHCLRKTLGDDRNGNAFIETVPRRGYRFIHAVRERSEPTGTPRSNGAAAGNHSRSAQASDPVQTGRQHRLEWIRRPSMRVMAAALAGVLVVFTGARLLVRSWPQPSSAPAKPAIAVLPFLNLSADPKDEYLSDGLTEELTSGLAQVDGLRVVARTSAYQFRGKGEDVRRIAQMLNVGAVLEGSVRRSGKDLRITSQLISAADGYHIWSQTYQADSNQLLAIPDEIVRATARALGMPEGRRAGGPATMRYTENPEAHDLYLQGRYFWSKRDPESMRKSVELLQRALAKDPAYVLAYAGLADSYAVMAANRVIPAGKGVPAAKQAAARAMFLAPALAEPHASLGLVKSLCEWDWRGGEEEFRQALERDPNNAQAHHWLALTYTVRGKFAEADAELREAQLLDPLSVMITYSVGENFYYWRRYDDVIEQARRILQMDPSDPRGHNLLVRAYHGKGMTQEALAEEQHARATYEPGEVAAGTRLEKLIASGNRVEARRLLDDPAQLSRAKLSDPFVIAILYTAMGEKESAFRWLDQAYQQRDPDLASLKVEPAFDDLRADPRYLELLKKISLSE